MEGIRLLYQAQPLSPPGRSRLRRTDHHQLCLPRFREFDGDALGCWRECGFMVPTGHAGLDPGNST